ncbi:MAG: zinc ribbon domain-containing protein [Acidobacteriota bacterium]
MPIYEFYCPDCNTVYSFFSSSIDTDSRPSCPRCGRVNLERKPSRFAALRGGSPKEESDDESALGDLGGNLDEERMERAMAAMAGEMEGFGDGDGPEDPRALARMLRKFGDATGLDAGPRMEEMLRRLESGEDPDELESEMSGEGGTDDDGDLSDFFQVRKAAKAARRPKVDETLYFL